MKISRVSIHGFKSFMDRLEIAFSPGIIGIVGPNGCGKSNIVDAIRWCMGEQSPKQMRGRQMEDVIFNGTGEFKPLGMAEVSIFFEAGGRAFPPPFDHDAELSITRRLYRSGESEYLINNVPCRLKDVQEIFMDTGLGNKAYSIVGQGRIGAILEQKPEETRVMLEEAAGITKYRKKVEASTRKIELTEANLRRVEDILSEVERQMRSLKRQASKARRYNMISEKIQQLELVLYGNTYHQLKRESREKRHSTEALVEKEMAGSAKLSGLQAQLEAMGLELEKKDQNLGELRDRYALLKEKVHRKESALEALEREMKVLGELEGRLLEERRDIERGLAAKQEEKKDLEDKIQGVGQRALEVGKEIALSEERLRTRHSVLKQVRETFEKVRSEINERMNEEMGLTHESNYLNRRIQEITGQRERLENELKEAQSKIVRLARASEKKSLDREVSTERLDGIQAALDRENTHFKELEREKKQAEAELRSAEADLNVYQSRLQSLKTLTENFEGYQIGVRTIMKAKDLEPRQNGRIVGLVADVIQVDPRYEQAVEAVLADKLQYIIVESQEDAKQAVNYLKSKSRGKSSFAPLKDLGGNGKLSHPPTRFPFLRDLVQVPEQFRPLVDTLLGDTLLLDDLETAISLWRQNGRDQCLVTSEGDMVDQRGIISGGKRVQSSRGLLARKREMAELKEKVADCTERVDQLKGKVEKVASEMERKRNVVEALIEDRWGCQDEINDYDKALFRLSQELDQVEKLTRRIADDLAKKEREKTKHNEELSRVREDLDRRKRKREEEEGFLREKTAELKECEEEFEQYRERVGVLKSDHRILQEERRSLLREIDRVEDYAEESRKRMEKISEEIASGRLKMDECRERKAQGLEKLKEGYGELEALEARLDALDRERDSYRMRLKEKEDRVDDVRREIQSLKDKINRARMEESEVGFRMTHLEGMVREKFDLDLREIYSQYVEEDFSAPAVEEELEKQKGLRQKLGEVNLTAIKEHEALMERHEFIMKQRQDLVESIESLRKVIRRINRTSLEKYQATFREVDRKLKEIFPILFNGGTAALRMQDETRPLDSGVLVEVRPPGKKLTHMGLLSGGEKALVAMALLFAIYMIKPSPFCLLDEVDAPLDEANVDRFNDLLKEITRSSQIIMVTHNRRTMEIAERLYGVTMERAGISKLVSVDLQGLREKDIADPSAQSSSLN